MRAIASLDQSSSRDAEGSGVSGVIVGFMAAGYSGPASRRKVGVSVL
jgi:hypothetical protein